MTQRYRPETYTQEQSNKLGSVFYTETPIPKAIAFRGAARKCAWHFRFRTTENLHAKIAEFFSSLEARAAATAKRKKDRLEIDASQHFAVGDVVYNTWGYDQTNADFYQVMKVCGRSLVLRQLASRTTETGFMSGHSVPVIGEFDAHDSYPERHFVYPGYDSEPRVHFKFGCGSKWNGKPVGCSWYA